MPSGVVPASTRPCFSNRICSCPSQGVARSVNGDGCWSPRVGPAADTSYCLHQRRNLSAVRCGPLRHTATLASAGLQSQGSARNHLIEATCLCCAHAWAMLFLKWTDRQDHGQRTTHGARRGRTGSPPAPRRSCSGSASGRSVVPSPVVNFQRSSGAVSTRLRQGTLPIIGHDAGTPPHSRPRRISPPRACSPSRTAAMAACPRFPTRAPT